MDRKAALLESMRIDRTAAAGYRGRGGRMHWLIGMAVVVPMAAATGIWAFAVPHGGIPVQTVVAQAADTKAGGATGGSLLDASGYVVALRETTVSAKSIYKINEVLIQEGQRVEAGQIIARLDDSNTRAALEQSRAQVGQLKASLAAAKLAAADARPTFERDKGQLAEGLISPEAFDSTKSTYDAAQAAVLVAAENLAVAEANVKVNERYEDDTIVKAPFGGVVTTLNAQTGEILSPQFSGGGGIAKIVDMDSLEVEVDVSENFINRVHPGQPATVTLSAYVDWRIPAEVIAVIPSADRAKATVKVRVRLKQRDSRIVPEMSARVSFLADASQPLDGTVASPGVIVPAAAVQADGDAGTVFVVNGDAVERRSVRLGARRADSQTILSGIQPGAILAIGDFTKLGDRSKVRITP